ncbi:MAG: GAF domain-containing protein, partial [Gammaproteobacteria bacterium]|nr:GAF domain-containing protein [Gammaproteobacteria bacterium]
MSTDSVIAGVDDRDVFRSIFAAYPDALLLVDPGGTIILANPAADELLGYPPGAMKGLPVDELVPDAIRPNHAAFRSAYNTQPRPRPMGLNMNLVAKRRDGSEVMVEIALSPLGGASAPLVVAAIRGVGAYPRVKQALKRAHLADSLAQFGRLAVDARDPHLLIGQAAPAVLDALRVDTALILVLEANGVELRIAGGAGLFAPNRIGDRVPNDAGSVCGHVIARGEPVLIDDFAHQSRFELLAPGHGAKSGCVLAVPLSDRGRTIGALSVRSEATGQFGEDELRFLESMSSLLATVLQRAQSEDALSHAQRLESIGQLTGGVAHDFNNLLTVISGNLQVLEEVPACADDPMARQLIASAFRATSRGAELTGKLLAFSRRQMLQPTPVDTGALLRSLTELLRRTLDQRIGIALDADASWCMADAGQLESALLNIAINARD